MFQKCDEDSSKVLNYKEFAKWFEMINDMSEARGELVDR